MNPDYLAHAAALAKATRAPLQLVPGEGGPDPTAVDLALEQTESAIALGRRDVSDAPRWRWRDLDRLSGPMLPGELLVVGALYGNGKTSFLLSQLDAFAAAKVPLLYLPLEVDPADLRRRWAAWALGLDWEHVARNAWDQLPAGAQDAHEEMLVEQAKSGLVQCPPERRLTMAGLARWMRWGITEFGARVVIIDHFHRLDFGSGAQYRVAVTEAARTIKDLATEHRLVVIAAAQLNHNDADALDRYFPPTLRRLKESAGLAEEPDAVLMLSRRLRGIVSRQDMLDIKAGFRSDRDFAEPNTMAVTFRKHRLADAIAGDRTVLLSVERGGRVVDRAPSYRRDYQEAP